MSAAISSHKTAAEEFDHTGAVGRAWRRVVNIELEFYPFSVREGDAFLVNMESGPKIMLIGREESERKQLDAR